MYSKKRPFHESNSGGDQSKKQRNKFLDWKRYSAKDKSRWPELMQMISIYKIKFEWDWISTGAINGTCLRSKIERVVSGADSICPNSAKYVYVLCRIQYSLQIVKLPCRLPYPRKCTLTKSSIIVALILEKLAPRQKYKNEENNHIPYPHHLAFPIGQLRD